MIKIKLTKITQYNNKIVGVIPQSPKTKVKIAKYTTQSVLFRRARLRLRQYSVNADRKGRVETNISNRTYWEILLERRLIRFVFSVS